MAIKFGTDGWRAVLADEFTVANLKMVVQAVADYLREEGYTGREIVVGYDQRFLAERLAEETARVLRGNGFPVVLGRGALPTPVIAFALKRRGAAGALMLTASHNPPEYNGIKFIPDYAGPALPEVTDIIEKHLAVILQGGEVKETGERDWKEIDPRAEYFEHLRRLIQPRGPGKKKKIVVDPLFGAGIGFLENILPEYGWKIETLHDYRDPLFGGMLPDPGPQAMQKLRERVLASGAVLGLALDGDADRFGVVDETGRFYSPNQMLAIFLDYLVNEKHWRGPVARSNATTHLLDRIAQKAGLEIIETSVGFKYIGRALLKEGCILGGEESGGMSIKGHIPEKDGILAGLLAAEIAAGGSLSEKLDGLYRKHGPVYSERIDLPVDPAKKPVILAALEKMQPQRIAGRAVMSRDITDGVKFILEEESWVLIRPSGTEPIFRIYTEAPDRETVGRIQNAVCQELNL